MGFINKSLSTKQTQTDRHRQTDRQTQRQTHLYHLKVAAGLPLLETQVRLRLSCSCGTDRQTDRQTHLYHLKVAAGLPLLETQVRLRLSCSCGTDRQTHRQTDSPEPPEGCSRLPIVGDTGQVEALLLMWYRQTDRHTDSPEPLECCSRFTIVGDTGQVEALLFMWNFHQGSVGVSVNHNVLRRNCKTKRVNVTYV